MQDDSVIRDVLKKADITYVVVNKEDFDCLTHPKMPVSLVDLLNDKLGI